MKPTNGHRSYASWNVYQWLANDVTLHGAAMAAMKQAEEHRNSLKSPFLRSRPIAYYAAPILLKMLPPKTPDNKSRYTVMALREALKMLAG